MSNKQKRLQEVYDHLRRWYGIHTQTDFANSMRYSRNAISLALNGNEKYLTDSLFKNICEAYPGVFDIDYLLTGKGSLLVVEEEVRNEELDKMVNPKQPEIPDFAQRLFDEAVRMSTRNELLERQCENLIAELRDTKSKNEDFLSELRKSKEDNDAMVAELRISYEQNKALISELRETRNENRALTERLEEAIDNIEGMKNQVAMMAGAYNTAQQPTFAPSLVNDKIVFPEGFIRGDHTIFTEELVKKAAEILQPKSKRK